CVPLDAEFSHADGWADAPPIFFLRHQKENAPRPVEKKKCWAQTCTCVQVCLNTRVGVRWCLRVCEDWPTGAAGCGGNLNADSRGTGAVVNGVQERI
ncbi:hypothetical protein, partial [uncultured Oscillibacter sp.]|uniref:hypothetical protein n=1 Tax=uncultured Oscillibacter sp. TaxID=876091 RepID=UPI0026165A5D